MFPISRLTRPAALAAPASALALALSALLPAEAWAQTPKVFFACYVPASGTVYRIKEPGLKDACASDKHVEFSWTEAAAAGADHGAFSGLADDDHPQYLLADGARHSGNGFAVTGTMFSGSGTITAPASGPGVRLVWWPTFAAFRAGEVDGDHWDAFALARHSVALGHNTRAQGDAAVALGHRTSALGPASIALGRNSTAFGTAATATGFHSIALGDYATAMGENSVAAGRASVALGHNVAVSQDFSVVLGSAGAAGHVGSFVFGDATTGTLSISTTRDNQVVWRAQHFWFGADNSVTNPAGHFLTTSTGAFLSTGGTWTNNSDVSRKADFEAVEPEWVLGRLATLPIQRWRYQQEDPPVRHLGPTAQDFHHAFGLGQGETAIATVDADGVALLAAQALERRTAELRAENDDLRKAVETVLRRVAELEARLAERHAPAASESE